MFLGMRASEHRASWVAFALMAILAAGCTEEKKPPPNVSTCKEGSPACGPTGGPTGGGSVGAGGGGGAGGEGGGGSVPATTVEGSVFVVANETFDSGFDLGAPATVIAPAAAGGTVEAAYDGSSFELEGVPAEGELEFYVSVPVDATGAMSTISTHVMPPEDDLALPVVALEVLTFIGTTLPEPITIDTTRGQVILRIVRDDKPLSGVSVSSAGTEAIVAFDVPSGLYSTDATSTGPDGLILLLNALPNPQLPHATMKLSDGEHEFVVSVPIVSGYATYRTIPL